MLNDVCCSFNNNDYVSKFNSSDISAVVSSVDKWLVWPLPDWTSTL
jgi:hypothetical protein